MSDETAEIAQPAEPPSTEGHTTPLPVTAGAWGRPQVALLFLAVAAASFLLGIAIATSTQQRPDETVLASAEIGPSGGTIRFEGGEIVVPEGAVDGPVRFSVHRSLVGDRIRVVGTDDPPLVYAPGRLTAYRLSPTDVSFSRPVELTFRLPDGASNGTAFARRDSTVVILSGTVDAGRGTVTALIGDFRFEGSD